MLCQARLTNYHKTKTKIGTQDKWNATYLKLCGNEAEPNADLCVRCAQRPAAARNQITMIHGTLSEEIPYTSRIYGGPWYWDMVQRYGEPLDTVWIEAAKAAQAAGEKRAASAGKVPWCIANLRETIPKGPKGPKGPMEPKGPKGPKGPTGPKDQKVDVKEEQQEEAMPPKKKLPASPAKPEQQLPFKPIPQLFQEAADEPTKIPTDTQTIRKEKGMWISATGHCFAVNEDGSIGKFIGKT